MGQLRRGFGRRASFSGAEAAGAVSSPRCLAPIRVIAAVVVEPAQVRAGTKRLGRFGAGLPRGRQVRVGGAWNRAGRFPGLRIIGCRFRSKLTGTGMGAWGLLQRGPFAPFPALSGRPFSLAPFVLSLPFCPWVLSSLLRQALWLLENRAPCALLIGGGGARSVL